MYSRRDVESALSQRVVGPMCLLNNVDFFTKSKTAELSEEEHCERLTLLHVNVLL